MKSCAFVTLGCKVNQYETQVMRDKLINGGYREVSFREKADAYVINTCTVTQQADRKSRQLIREANRRNPQATIVVTGCYVELDFEEILKVPGVNLIIGNNFKGRINQLLSQASSKLQSPPIIVKDLNSEANSPKRPYSLNEKIYDFQGHTRAFLKIQDGCNYSCSFCKVPLVRGRSTSRDPEEIEEEARRLIERGFKEIVLTGICLGDYGLDISPEIEIVDIIERLEKLEGLFRIRLSSLEPRHVVPRLIEKMASGSKLCRHLHLPFQSGDEDILRLMRRNYGVDDYRHLVRNLKEAIPNISITTDILVGFPGEGEKHFLNTLRFIDEIRPSRIHIFPFSKRRGTAAFHLPKEVDQKVIKEREKSLQAKAKTYSLQYRKMFLNRQVEVLVEANKDRETGLYKGYTDTYIKVHVKGAGEAQVNNLIPASIVEVNEKYTLARLLR